MCCHHKPVKESLHNDIPVIIYYPVLLVWRGENNQKDELVAHFIATESLYKNFDRFHL